MKNVIKKHSVKSMQLLNTCYSHLKFCNEKKTRFVCHNFTSTWLLITLFSLSDYASAQRPDSLSVSGLKKLSLEELLNIEVFTASGSEQKLSEAPSTMIVITAQQIEERGYIQLEDVLRDIPGIDLIHTYGHAPTFFTFRGMYGDQNNRMLFMIDGIIENNLMGGFEMAGPAYSLYNVERIEIIWGPGSALYGANAYSAVINLITKKGDDINGVHYQKGFGTFNTSAENVMFGLKKSGLPAGAQLELALSGSLYSTDGPRFTNRHPEYNNSYINNAWSFNGQIGYTIKKLKTTLGVRTYQTNGGVGELAASPTSIFGLPSQGNQNPGDFGMLQADFNGEKASYGEIFARTAFLQSEFTANEKLTITATAQYRETGVSDKSYVYLKFPTHPVFVYRHKFAYNANRIKGEISANYIFNEHHSLSAGIQNSQDNLERSFRGENYDIRIFMIEKIPVVNLYATFKQREYTIQNNLGSYLQYVLQTDFLRKTNLTIGGRYDYNSIYGTTINPRAGLINQPHEKLTLKLLYGSAYRAPTNFELYTEIETKIANPDLTPEKIQTYEANIIYTPDKKIMIQVNLFQNELKDIIVSDVAIEGGLTQNQNTGTASIKGLETRLDFIPSNSFTSFLNFTFQEGTQKQESPTNGFTESEIPNIAKVKGNIGFSFYAAHLFNISLITNWVGNRSVPDSNPLGKVSEYCISHLVISTNKLFKNRVSASIIIRNLFNQSYYDPGIGEGDGKFYPTVYDQPGINGMFRISISLF